jgi:hypothetical protein
VKLLALMTPFGLDETSGGRKTSLAGRRAAPRRRVINHDRASVLINPDICDHGDMLIRSYPSLSRTLFPEAADKPWGLRRPPTPSRA